MSRYRRRTRGVMLPHGERRVLRCSARSIRVHAGLQAGGRVAAMPSFVRIKRVSVIGVAFAAFTIPVATASADDVWLWACHGPGGQALPNLGTRADPGAGGSCSVDNGGDSDALHLNAASGLTRSFQVPSQVTLGEINLGRTTALTAG